MSTLKTDNISPNGSTVNVTSGLNVQGGATLAAVKITGNLDVDGNVFGVNATTNTVTVSSPANTTPVLLLGVSANSGTTHRSILRFGHDQNSSSIPVGEIHGVVDNTAGASQRAGHIEFSTANAGVIAERMRLAADGSLNIGTSNPVENTPLLVQGPGDSIATIRLQIAGSGGSLNYGSMIVSGTQASSTIESRWINSFVLEGVPVADSTGASGSTIISSFNRDLQFHTGTRAERMRIKADGKIGIGTESPTDRLNIHTASAADNILRFTNASSGTGSGNGFILGQFSNADCYVWNEEQTNILFATSGTQRMTIDSSGNVGIGINAPTNRLHVVGTSPDTAPVFISNGAGGDDQTEGNCMGLRIRAGDGSGTATLLDVQSSDGATTHFAVRKDGVVARGRSIMGGFMPNSIARITGARGSSSIFSITVPGTSTEKYMGIIQRPNYSLNQGDGVFSFYLSDESGPVGLTGGASVNINIDGGINVGTPYAPTSAWLHGLTIFWWRVS